MIKSIKFKNSSCFLDEQNIVVYSNEDTEAKKKINLIFGVPGTGKTAIFDLLKTTIYYMRRWIYFGDDLSVLSGERMWDHFNPNICTQFLTSSKNFTEVEIVFDSGEFSYKYEWAFNKHYCLYEKLSYKINGLLDEWIELFDKELIDHDEIDERIETMYEVIVNYEDLEIEYNPSFKGIDKKNSIISYISNISKAEYMKEFTEILKKIEFFEYKDFLGFKNFSFPYDELLNSKKDILDLLKRVKINIDDFKLEYHNKLTGSYSINLISKDSEHEMLKVINSSKLSKGEVKLFLFIVLFNRYRKKDAILFIDDFASNIQLEIFFEIIKAFEKESINGTNFQLFALNNHFFNKMKIYNSKYINIFDIQKDEKGNSKIKLESNLDTIH